MVLDTEFEREKTIKTVLKYSLLSISDRRVAYSILLILKKSFERNFGIYCFMAGRNHISQIYDNWKIGRAHV